MHDLVTLGEALLRLSVPSPERFETARHLDVQVGGAEANVAATCARLGLRTAWISALPANVWGQRVRRELRGHGVDTAHVVESKAARLGMYFVEYGVAPRPIRIVYDRDDSAFARLTPSMVDWAPVRDARISHVTGVTAALGENGRALVRRLIREASAVSFDVNYRAALWTPSDARDFLDSVLTEIRYLFVGEAEVRTVFGVTLEPEAAIEMLERRAPKATIALLQGQDGSTVLHEGRIWRPSVRYRVEVVDPIGAGDAYAAGYLWATLSGRSTQEVVDVATTVAALKCSAWGDIAPITEQDVMDALRGGPDVRR